MELAADLLDTTQWAAVCDERAGFWPAVRDLAAAAVRQLRVPVGAGIFTYARPPINFMEDTNWMLLMPPNC